MLTFVYWYAIAALAKSIACLIGKGH